MTVKQRDRERKAGRQTHRGTQKDRHSQRTSSVCANMLYLF